jgi:HEAT repeat protein
VLARRLHALGRRPPVSGWNELVDALHAAAPLSRAAVLVLCDLDCDAETRRIDVILLLRGTGGRAAERRLVQYLGDPALRVVRAAIHALGACGTHRATEALAALSGTHDGAARRALARIHARLGEVRGAVSEGTPAGDGGVSVVRRRADGRVSEAD